MITVLFMGSSKMFYDLSQYQKLQYSSNPDLIIDHLIFLSKVLIMTVYFILLRSFVHWMLYSDIYNFLQPEKCLDDSDRQFRASQISLFIFEVFYYGIMVLAAVVIMKETPEFIKVFNFELNQPYQKYGELTPVIPFLKEYQIIQFGFQLQIFILHFI